MIENKRVLLYGRMSGILLLILLFAVQGKPCSAKTETAIAEEVIQTTADVLQSEEPDNPVQTGEPAVPPEPAASVNPSEIPAPTQTPPAGKLVKKKYKTFYILAEKG